eukprot:gene19056-biopygen12994
MDVVRSDLVSWPLPGSKTMPMLLIQQAALALAGGEPLPPTSDQSDIAAGPPMPRPGGWQVNPSNVGVQPSNVGAAAAAAVPAPACPQSPGAGALLPAYMSGAAQDPPRATREEVGQALAYAHQAGLKYPGGYFTYTGSNRR